MPRKAAGVESDGKRYPMNMRATKALREKLERAASESGRSLSGEAEYRLEKALDDETRNWTGASDETELLVRTLASAMLAYERTRKKSWLHDAGARHALDTAFETIKYNLARAFGVAEFSDHDQVAAATGNDAEDAGIISYLVVSPLIEEAVAKRQLEEPSKSALSDRVTEKAGNSESQVASKSTAPPEETNSPVRWSGGGLLGHLERAPEADPIEPAAISAPARPALFEAINKSPEEITEEEAERERRSEEHRRMAEKTRKPRDIGL